MYCHKLLTDESIVKSERIHYNNTNSIIHKNNVNLANNQKNVVYYGAKKDMILSEFSELKDFWIIYNPPEVKVLYFGLKNIRICRIFISSGHRIRCRFVDLYAF